MQNIVKTKKKTCVIADHRQATDRQTNKQTDRQCNSMTESAKRVNTVKNIEEEEKKQKVWDRQKRREKIPRCK